MKSGKPEINTANNEQFDESKDINKDAEFGQLTPSEVVPQQEPNIPSVASEVVTEVATSLKTEDEAKSVIDTIFELNVNSDLSNQEKESYNQEKSPTEEILKEGTVAEIVSFTVKDIKDEDVGEVVLTRDADVLLENTRGGPEEMNKAKIEDPLQVLVMTTDVTPDEPQEVKDMESLKTTAEPQINTGPKKRKMGSTRRSMLSRKQQDEERQTENDMTISDNTTATDEKTIIATKKQLLPGDEKWGHTESPTQTKASNRQRPVKRTHFIQLKSEELSRQNWDKDQSQKIPQQLSQPFANVGRAQQSNIRIAAGYDPNASKYEVIMIGDSSVGKTSFMQRAQTGKFSPDVPASIGMDSYKWTVNVDGKTVVLHLWDTAGQERFRSMTRQIFHRAQAFLLMYDITCAQTFTAVSYWANCIRDGAGDNVVILLLGNKSDSKERKVRREEGELLAQEHDFAFIECSAATGENVIEALEAVARLLNQKHARREEPLLLRKPEPRNKGCC
ncbi:hypothetical protein WMY93_012348 [Mugilogobius chulae]|uniref:Uncharacterized protein n=1 Tax=Mugilogobius chulae TaxID=88201 RepID=A0AAW0P4R9_9GOBI